MKAKFKDSARIAFFASFSRICRVFGEDAILGHSREKRLQKPGAKKPNLQVIFHFISRRYVTRIFSIGSINRYFGQQNVA